MRKFIKIISLFTLLISQLSIAQTKVSGIVVDEKKVPMPFVYVSFQNGKGIETDMDGKFTIESKTVNYTAITASFVGFVKQVIALKSNDVLGLTIELKEDNTQLKEVKIVKKPKKHLAKKDNPAFRILKGIWANKKRNGLSLVKAYSYKKYTSTTIGLSNLDTVFMKKMLGKAFDSVIHIVEKKEKMDKYIVPVYMKEINEGIFGNNVLKKERTEKFAERSVGVGQQGFLFDRITNTFSDVNIYENDIVILNKNFVSPISERGFGSYEYVLHDSIVDADNKKSYQIYFFPRQNGDLVFQGNFMVADKSFAISNITMRVNKGINLNLVRNLSIEKEFKIENDSIFLPERDFYEGDFTLLTKSDEEKGVYVRKNMVYSDYDLENKQEDSYYDVKDIQTTRDQYNKDEQYWSEIKTKDKNLEETKKVIGELKNNPRVKRITGFVNVLATGYFDLFKNIQFGSFYNAISNNDIDGFRLRAGFRSFKSVDDFFRANSYIVYGTKDQKFKYAIEAKWLVSQNPRITIGAARIDDNFQFGGRTLNVNDLWSGNSTTNLLINRGQNIFLSKIDKNSLMVNLSVTNNFNITASAAHQHIVSAADPSLFSIDYTTDNGTTVQNKVTDFNTSITLQYTPKRFVYGFGVDQRYGRSLYSALTLKLNKGISGIGGSQFNYSKIQLGYDKPFVLSNLGILETYFEAGKTFGALPLPLLNAVPSNQGYSIVPKTFILLDYFDMVTDTYAMAHFNHHFNGIIFNRIPYLKKLGLREVVFYRGILGSISQDNININRSNLNYSAPNKKVYGEYGFGIENIGYGNFRPIRLDFVWRTNFVDVNGLSSPKFGLRVEFRPEF